MLFVFFWTTSTTTFSGYGHSTPHTIGGKLFTMAYALVGIPLGLVMFQSIGERLNNFSSFVIRNVKRVLKYDNVEASETNLILVVTAITTITISGGAAAFSKYEGWTYFDSIYYCFVTLTTIGFGDMVALQQDNALTDKPEYVAFVLIFILFGLAIVAACLNLLVLRLVTLNTEDERRDEAAAVKVNTKIRPSQVIQLASSFFFPLIQLFFLFVCFHFFRRHKELCDSKETWSRLMARFFRARSRGSKEEAEAALVWQVLSSI